MGYAFAEQLSLEAGYLAPVDVDAGLALRSDRSRSFAGEWSNSALYGALLWYPPSTVAHVAQPFVKVGVARWESELSLHLDGARASSDTDAVDALIGVGVDVSPPGSPAPLALRAEYVLLLLDQDDGGLQHRLQVGVDFTL